MLGLRLFSVLYDRICLEELERGLRGYSLGHSSRCEAVLLVRQLVLYERAFQGK